MEAADVVVDILPTSAGCNGVGENGISECNSLLAKLFNPPAWVYGLVTSIRLFFVLTAACVRSGAGQGGAHIFREMGHGMKRDMGGEDMIIFIVGFVVDVVSLDCT